MVAGNEPAYFTDENLLGLGRLLTRSGRTDVVYPGHPGLPEVPLGTPDLDWMPLVAGRGLLVLTRERRIRTRPVELTAYRAHGIRSVRVGGKRDLAPSDAVEIFLRHEERLVRHATRLGAGPWALLLTHEGVREIRLGS